LGYFLETYSQLNSMSSCFTYMGTKRQIADDVARVISSSRRGPLLDLFAGVSAVGSAVAPERQVWCNDVQHFAHALATSIFTSREGPRLNPRVIDATQELAKTNRKKISREIDDLLSAEQNLLASGHVRRSSKFAAQLVRDSVLPSSYRLRRLHRSSDMRRPYRLFTSTYAGGYIGLKQAVDLDSLRYAIDMMRDSRQITIEQHRWLLLGLCRALAKIAHTTGHFAQYLSIKESTYQRFAAKRRRDVLSEWLEAVGEMHPEGTASWRRMNRTFRMDAVSLLKVLPRSDAHPAVIYADPPYTSDHYSRYYHLQDTLVLYDYPDPVGKGQYRSNRFVSEFSIRTRVYSAFHQLIGSAAELGCELVLNYPENGLLPEPRSSLLQILKQYFRRAEVALAIAHEHSSLGASKGVEKSPVTELVFYAR
jgi:adenine-specific DNA-methyltransferase